MTPEGKVKGLVENFQRVGCPVQHDCMVEPCLAEDEKHTVGDSHHRKHDNQNDRGKQKIDGTH